MGENAGVPINDFHRKSSAAGPSALSPSDVVYKRGVMEGLSLTYYRF